MTDDRDPQDRTVRLRVGHDEIVVGRKYEAASICNDVMVAVWFVAGSILFFSESTTTIGTWLFLIGSIQLLIRPVIRLARHVHMRRLRGDSTHGASFDY